MAVFRLPFAVAGGCLGVFGRRIGEQPVGAVRAKPDKHLFAQRETARHHQHGRLRAFPANRSYAG